MKVSLEHLYHYQCDGCTKWWTIADIQPVVGNQIFCPHCGNANTVEIIESHLIESDPATNHSSRL